MEVQTHTTNLGLPFTRPSPLYSFATHLKYSCVLPKSILSYIYHQQSPSSRASEERRRIAIPLLAPFETSLELTRSLAHSSSEPATGLTGNMTISPCSCISALTLFINTVLETASELIGASGSGGVPSMNLTVTRCFGKSGRITWRYLGVSLCY